MLERPLPLAAALTALGAALFAAKDATAQSTDACIQAFHLGQEQRAALTLRAARESFSLCSQTKCPAELRADCAEALAVMLPDIPSIVPGARRRDGTDLRDLTVYVDGVPAPVGLGGSLEVDPGLHDVRFESPGLAPKTVSLVVRVGERNRPVTMTLDATDLSESGAASGSRPNGPPARFSPWVYPLAGLGVLALGSFAYFGVSGVSARSDALDRCAPRCDEADEARVRGRFIVADVSLAVGVAALAGAAAVLLATHRPAGR